MRDENDETTLHEDAEPDEAFGRALSAAPAAPDDADEPASDDEGDFGLEFDEDAETPHADPAPAEREADAAAAAPPTASGLPEVELTPNDLAWVLGWPGDE